MKNITCTCTIPVVLTLHSWGVNPSDHEKNTQKRARQGKIHNEDGRVPQLEKREHVNWYDQRGAKSQECIPIGRDDLGGNGPGYGVEAAWPAA